MKKLLFPVFIVICSCQKSQPQVELPKEVEYEATPQAMQLTGIKLREVSGITYSRNNAEHLWANQDSGNPPFLYLIREDGTVADSLEIAGASNRDWEDLVCGNGPVDGRSYLYVGEIGDNNASYQNYSIFRFEEPGAGEQAVTNYEELRFVYDDGARDAEAFVVDNTTKDIYIITKREEKSRVYRIAYPQSASELNQANFLYELNYGGVVSAASSADGKEVLVKTYTQVFHYTKEPSVTIEDALKNSSPKILDYQLEPQGEAISFSASGDGFFTLSEEAMGVEAKLFFYRKK
jgi:hypothetical protein